MSEAITKTNLIIVLVLCFLIGYGIKEVFFTAEVETEDFSFSFKSEYLDGLESDIRIEFVMDENSNELVQYVEIYDGKRKVLDSISREEFEKEVEPYRESYAKFRKDLNEEELDKFLAFGLFEERYEERRLHDK
ncbi:hypothetical protein [Kangiella sp.]|uniref:hypothetical protein n=1 Tax=Kangiella sp. TaxID=1920245 RepID=UPI0019C05041|nr:hypothetical protein [Kangiella sp.]MBD3654373.1 hypothetical protein [Kangiella sp.]